MTKNSFLICVCVKNKSRFFPPGPCSRNDYSETNYVLIIAEAITFRLFSDLLLLVIPFILTWFQLPTELHSFWISHNSEYFPEFSLSLLDVPPPLFCLSSLAKSIGYWQVMLIKWVSLHSCFQHLTVLASQVLILPQYFTWVLGSGLSSLMVVLRLPTKPPPQPCPEIAWPRDSLGSPPPACLTVLLGSLRLFPW